MATHDLPEYALREQRIEHAEDVLNAAFDAVEFEVSSSVDQQVSTAIEIITNSSNAVEAANSLVRTAETKSERKAKRAMKIWKDMVGKLPEEEATAAIAMAYKSKNPPVRKAALRMIREPPVPPHREPPRPGKEKRSKRSDLSKLFKIRL